VCAFDCLHDMGDPVGASAHVFETLAPDGAWLIVEPFAGDSVQENLNPVGRVFYGASTVICTPASLSQEVGLALGAQAGEARLAKVIKQGGFSHVRRATETPFKPDPRSHGVSDHTISIGVPTPMSRHRRAMSAFRMRMQP